MELKDLDPSFKMDLDLWGCFGYKMDLKDLDPCSGYKVYLDLWDCFGRKIPCIG